MRKVNFQSSRMAMVGLVAGLLLAPTAATAATFFTIQGANGFNANVTSAHRLLTSSADEAKAVHVFSVSPGSEKQIYVVPTGSKLVVTDVTSHVAPFNGQISGVNVRICGSEESGLISTAAGNQDETVSEHLGVGKAFPAGTKICTNSSGSQGAFVNMHGYLQ
ncbi:hypothetical protein OG985_49755 (plasmid) [Streptomyces sp. NBC_00289]|uniref:hypothetical protein n=1 Tax=Streptomyces sp. NBC_00289 TaxID=2975703 RepID=UPI002F90F623